MCPNYRSTNEKYIMAKSIDRGLAKPDDPIYSTGLIVGGKRLQPSKYDSLKKTKVANLALARATKQVSAEMNAAMGRQLSGKAEN